MNWILHSLTKTATLSCSKKTTALKFSQKLLIVDEFYFS